MNIQDYYKQLNKQTQSVFKSSIENTDILGLVHDLVINIDDWIKAIGSNSSKELLNNAIEQIDISCLLVLNGLYRASYTSLRLSLEMITSLVYFSAHDIEYRKWKQGGYDIKWSTISDPENGILSHRFINIYFPNSELKHQKYLEKLKYIYRKLSEMVHGNFHTWKYQKQALEKDKDHLKLYTETIKEITTITNYVLSIRFLEELTHEKISFVDTHIEDSLGHEDILRTKIGGPK